jgi:hypothetical protein
MIGFGNSGKLYYPRVGWLQIITKQRCSEKKKQIYMKKKSFDAWKGLNVCQKNQLYKLMVAKNSKLSLWKRHRTLTSIPINLHSQGQCWCRQDVHNVDCIPKAIRKKNILKLLPNFYITVTVRQNMS